MQNNIAKEEWGLYVENEKRRVKPFLTRNGFVLDDEQPQTIGERYLTRPVGGGRKVVLFGHRENDGTRVVIKTSSEAQGMDELLHEKEVHEMLTHIRFAYGTFALPNILHFDKEDGLFITEYIAQEKPFLDRSLREQFSIALNAFKAQEKAHATTTGHWDELRRIMKTHAHYIKPGEYRKISEYAQDLMMIRDHSTELYTQLKPLLNRVIGLVEDNKIILERYDGFLTHWDFTPQNFRIKDGTIYLLDLTSIRFGNKYESWARFINFMVLYNSALTSALVDYIRLNRTEEEVLVLRIMRAYRLVELIRYYATWLGRTEGDTRLLAEARITFWTDVLEAVLDSREVPDSTIEKYKGKRDNLRSTDEKRRQQGLH